MPADRIEAVDESYDSDGEPQYVRRILGRVWGSEPSASHQAELSALVFSPHARPHNHKSPQYDEPQSGVEAADDGPKGRPTKARRRKSKGNKARRVRSVADGVVGERAVDGGLDEDDNDEDDDEEEEERAEERAEDGGQGGEEETRASRERNLPRPVFDAATVDAATARVRNALAGQWATIRSVFSQWDADGNGEIQLGEWLEALPRFGILDTADLGAAERLFELLDTDASGSLDYRELHVALRQGSEIELDAALQAGAVHFETAVHQHVAVRKQARQEAGSNTLNGLRVADAASLFFQLRAALTANMGRTIELFREWDNDQSGWVDREEFGRAIRGLRLKASRREVAQLFAALDESNDGQLQYGELHAKLRVTGERAAAAASAGGDAAEPGGRRSRPGADDGARSAVPGAQHTKGTMVRAGALASASGITARVRMKQEFLPGRLRLPEGVTPRVYALCNEAAHGTPARPFEKPLRPLPPVPVLPLTQPVRHRRKGNRLPPVDSLDLVLPPLAEAATNTGDAAAGEKVATTVRTLNAAGAAKLPSGGLSALKSILKDFDTTRAPDGPVTRKQVRMSDLTWDDVRQRQEKIGRGKVVKLGLRDRWRSDL